MSILKNKLEMWERKMLKPNSVPAPGLRMSGAGNGLYAFPPEENLSDFKEKIIFRLFKRNIHYYYNAKTGTKIYPSWYLTEIEKI